MAESSAFISYHHSDRIIAEVLHDQLYFLAGRGQGKGFLRCFLDGRDIKKGENWQDAINKALAEKDWLVVIYTGDQSVYCGYEIGTFAQLHPDGTATRLIALHDIEPTKLPMVLAENQNACASPIDRVTDTRDVTLLADEVDSWHDSPFGTFFQEFCNYRKLYTPADAVDEPGSYKKNIALAAKVLTNAFSLARGADIKHKTLTQLDLEILIKNGAGKKALEHIPDDAMVSGRSVTFHALGLNLPYEPNQAPCVTWGELRRILGNGKAEVPWMHKVEGDILRVAMNLTVTTDSVTLRSGAGKIYRPIVMQYDLMFNGDRRFNIALIETLDRHFPGEEQSSLLLASVVLASRWRFNYFERWADTIETVFGERMPLAHFIDSCRQLLYNVEWIENEGAELGASDQRAMVHAFGRQHRARVDRFFEDYRKAKDKLTQVLRLDVEINEQNRQQIRAAIIEFLDSTRQQNLEFLILALQVYNDLLKSELRLAEAC